jgi:hypothetical protein
MCPPALTPLLALIDNSHTSSVEYVIGGNTLSGAAREAAAQLLADDAMKIACGNSPILDRWRARRDGGPTETGASLAAVKTYVAIGFNLPGDPVNNDHVQGHVAELLWNRLLQERTVCRDGRQLVRAHPVKADPLEPGGDGLVVYQDNQGTLVFRLWEIKKHDANQRVSATINRASKQLSSRGHEYLAKLAGPETITENGALGELYANMVELWFDRSERAGVGVSVGTSAHHAPTRPLAFRSITTAFPEFARAGQTESIVVAVPDFPGFADRVKEIVWSGL